MGTQIVNRRKARRPQVGDMKDRIDLQIRQLLPPAFGESEPTLGYTLPGTVWAQHDTTKGIQLFNGVEIGDAITDTFQIRYRRDVTTETRISFDGRYYEIAAVENLDGRKQFLFLMCKELGDNTVVANR